MSTRDIPNRAWAELGLLSLLWGGSFLAIRVALDEIPVATIVAFRIGLAALVLWGYVVLRGLPVPRSPRVWAALAVMGLLNNLIPWPLLTWGQLHIETGLASILNASTAVFGVLAAALFLGDEALTGRRAAGVALGFAGVVMAIGPGVLDDLDLRSAAQLAVIGASLSYALAGVWARVHLDLAPQVAAAGMLTCSAAVAVPFALWHDGPVIPQAADTWAAIAYVSVASTALAYLLYFRVLKMAGSGNTSLCTLAIAPVAILLGVWVLGERLMPTTLLGFGLLALGLAIIDGRVLRLFRRAATPGG